MPDAGIRHRCQSARPPDTTRGGACVHDKHATVRSFQTSALDHDQQRVSFCVCSLASYQLLVGTICLHAVRTCSPSCHVRALDVPAVLACNRLSLAISLTMADRQSMPYATTRGCSASTPSLGMLGQAQGDVRAHHANKRWRHWLCFSRSSHSSACSWN